MPNILWSLDFVSAKPPELNSFSRMVNKLYQQLARIVNGQIAFGNGISRDNIDGNWVATATPVVPNTDFTLTHNLGRIPVGYIIATKDMAVDIYTGGVSWTATQITLKASVGSATVNLFIF